MGAPQIIYLSLVFIDLLYTAHMHGKPRDTKYNIFFSIIGASIAIALLCWGGFFR